MWGVAPDGKIVITAAIAGLPENAHLADHKDDELVKPSNPGMAPDSEALDWHMENIVKKVTAA
jgi:hypothetical protein